MREVEGYGPPDDGAAADGPGDAEPTKNGMSNRLYADGTADPSTAELTAATVGAGVADAPLTPSSGFHPVGPYPQPVRPPESHGPSSGEPPLQAPGPETLPAPRWGLGGYLIAEAVFIGASLLVYIATVGEGPPSAGAVALALGVPTVLSAATALLVTRLRGNGPRIDLRLEWSWHDVGLGLAFGFGGLLVSIPASFLYVTIVGENASAAASAAFEGVTASPVIAVLVVLIFVVVAPVCEEIVYRGLLWGGVERLGGRWVAFAVTTLVFALAHFEFTRTPLLLVVAIPIAAARLYTGRLLASIVAHQINNLLPGLVLLLALLGVVPLP